MPFFRNDVIVVKFPFASSTIYKARPAVVLSSEAYNLNRHRTLLIMAISSKTDTALPFEYSIEAWREAGLLKPSVFKAAIATIEEAYVIEKIGTLGKKDARKLKELLSQIICI